MKKFHQEGFFVPIDFYLDNENPQKGLFVFINSDSQAIRVPEIWNQIKGGDYNETAA